MEPPVKPVVLITGGGSGIGLACAGRFAAEGRRVVVVDRDPSGAADVAAESGGFLHSADVRDGGAAKAAVGEAVRRLGRLDALVTCAGISRESSLTRMTDEEWEAVRSIDLDGTFYYLRAAGEAMREQKGGAIVTISSTLASRSRRHLANYCAAKAGVEGLTRAAARDLGPHGIRVNCVAPGLVRTPLMERIPADVRAKLIEDTPLRRFADPADVAEVILFLASDRARHVTGEVIRVDGGLLA